MASLRAKIGDYQRKNKTSTARELREPWLIDGDLAEQADDLARERERIVNHYAGKRARLADDDDERMAGPDTSDLDAAEAAELAELDAKVSELREVGEEQTVYLIFRPIPGPRYDELYHAAVTEAAKKTATRTAESVLMSLVAAESFVGVESDGELDTTETWDGLKALTDSEDDFGVPLMTPGFIDYVESKAFALNRRIPTAPFWPKPSAQTVRR